MEENQPRDGLIFFGRPADVIGFAVALELTKRMGCTWPAEVCVTEPEPWMTAVAGPVRAAKSPRAALAASSFDRAVFIPGRCYPVALPCRLTEECGGAALSHWDDPSDEDPFVVDLRAAEGLLSTELRWPVALAEGACSHARIAHSHTVSGSRVFPAGGMMRIVRRRPNLFTYWDNLGDGRLPHESLVIDLVREFTEKAKRACETHPPQPPA